MFVKEGSFIPIWSAFRPSSTADYDLKDLSVIYYPSYKHSTGEVFDDDGITKNAVSELISFTGITTRNKIHIRIGTNASGKYLNGFKRNILLGFPMGSPDILRAFLNGKPIQINSRKRGIPIPFNGKSVTLEIVVKKKVL